MKTVILIPAHNAVCAIKDVITRVNALGFPVVVVDDGSNDATYEAAKSVGADALRHQSNMGKGAALRTGFEHILKTDFDAVITMDADGQHDPASLKDFTAKAESGSQFIVGSRMSDTAKMPWIRVKTNKLLSWILSRKMKQYVPDSQSGYRLIKNDLLKKLKFSSNRYEIESEMLIQAARAGVKIDTVPIKSIYSGHKSSINPLVDTFRFIRLMIKL